MVAGIGAVVMMTAAADADAQSLEQRARQQRLKAMSDDIHNRTFGKPPSQWTPETKKLMEQYRAEATSQPFQPPDTSKVGGPGDLVPGAKSVGGRSRP